MTTKSNRSYLYQLDYIRAIASLAVCIFHLTIWNGVLSGNPTNWGYQLALWGRQGVEMFFVLSGFVICWSIPDNYQLADFRQFLIKRIVRIEPPYLLSIVLVIVIGFIAAQFTNNEFSVTFLDILYHLGYLNNFHFGEYLNVVYWTLGIEFQFYLFIGVFIVLLLRFPLGGILALAGLSLLSLLDYPYQILISYLPLFTLGIVLFSWKTNRLLLGPTILLIISLSVLTYWSLGIKECIAGVFTVTIIISNLPYQRFVHFFSKISYSLYLIHVPIGVKVTNLSLKFFPSNSIFIGLAVFFISLGVSILFAYIFYLIAEKPFISISKKVLYS